MEKKNVLRFLFLFVAVILFAGLVIFSLFRVKYPVEGTDKNEFEVIDLTTTDSIRRGQDGDFLSERVSTDTGISGEDEPVTKPEPCPT